MSLHERMRVSENPYCWIFYAVLPSKSFASLSLKISENISSKISKSGLVWKWYYCLLFKLFAQKPLSTLLKTPSQMFGSILNTPLLLSQRGKIVKIYLKSLVFITFHAHGHKVTKFYFSHLFHQTLLKYFQILNRRSKSSRA